MSQSIYYTANEYHFFCYSEWKSSNLYHFFSCWPQFLLSYLLNQTFFAFISPLFISFQNRTLTKCLLQIPIGNFYLLLSCQWAIEENWKKFANFVPFDWCISRHSSVSTFVKILFIDWNLSKFSKYFGFYRNSSGLSTLKNAPYASGFTLIRWEDSSRSFQNLSKIVLIRRLTQYSMLKRDK